MKATDLRIGNYIFLNDENEGIIFQHQIVVTYSIGKELIGTEYKSKKSHIIRAKEDIDLIQPIPLTEEWFIEKGYLIKTTQWKGNGADYQPETSKTKQKRIKLFSDIVIVFEYTSYRISKNTQWITDKGIFIEHFGDSIYLVKYEVHWLQNLIFALTGKELTK